MTNKELITIFKLAESESENIFDIYDYLSNYEDKYQELKIASIKSTIYEAYETYYNHKNKIIEAVKYILNEVDFSSIVEAFDFTELLEQIPEEYMGVFKQLIEDTLDK